MKDPSSVVVMAYLVACLGVFYGRPWWVLKGLGFGFATLAVASVALDALGTGMRMLPALVVLALVGGAGLWLVLWNRRRASQRDAAVAEGITARALQAEAEEREATARREARQAASASKGAAPGGEP